MATVTPSRLLTAEEFFRLPEPTDGSKQELVRGEIITMPPPGGRHGAVCSRVNRLLGNFVDAQRLGTVFSNDVGFVTERQPDSVRGPDVAYWSHQRLPQIPEGYIEVAPELAVEVLSPSNRPRQVREKLREYFERGVVLVWLLDPENRTVTIYRNMDEGKVLHEAAQLTGEEVLPGFQCAVSELFV